MRGAGVLWFATAWLSIHPEPADCAQIVPCAARVQQRNPPSEREKLRHPVSCFCSAT
jgi:hypothetical protein